MGKAGQHVHAPRGGQERPVLVACFGDLFWWPDLVACFGGSIEVSKASPAGAEIRCQNWPVLISSPMVTRWPVLAAFFGGLFWRPVLTACFSGPFWWPNLVAYFGGVAGSSASLSYSTLMQQNNRMGLTKWSTRTQCIRVE